jgi:hypothetical protein
VTQLTVGWRGEDPVGMELAEVTLDADRLGATGVAIRSGPPLYRLDYTLETGAGFATVRLRVDTRGQGWRRHLDLRRSPVGRWTAATSADAGDDIPAPGGDLSGLDQAQDCDLGLSPLTNTMPVLRHRLLEGGDPVELLMAWVSVPDLSVHASRQRYVPLGPNRVRYEDAGGDFQADLVFDGHGLVLHYPGIGRRL